MPARTTVIASSRNSLAKPLWLLYSSAIVFLICLELSSPLYAQRRNDRTTRKREVVEVKIEGNASIPTNELSSWITTRPSSWIERTLHWINSSWGRPRQYVDEAILMSDTESVSDYYRAKGFLEVRVSYRLDEDKEDVAEWSRVRDANRFLPPTAQEEYPDIKTVVVFLITEGPAYKVAGFTFEGFQTLPFDLLERVTSEIGIARGSQYNAEEVVNEDERVRELLGENGYPFFRRDSIIVESIAGTKTVGITVYFQTGHRYRMGDLKIVYDTLGAEGRVNESTIRKLVPYEKGSWVQLSVMKQGERNLYTLGTFDLVFIYPDTSAISHLPDSLKDGQEVPIIVELRSQVTIDISPGIFIAQTAAKHEFAAGITGAYNHRNLFGGAEKLALNGSWQIFPLTQSRWDAGASLEFPFALFDAPLQIGTNYSHTEIKNAFLENSYSARVGSRINLPDLNISIRPNIAIEYLRRGIFSEQFDTLKLPNEEQFNLITSVTGIYDVTNDFLNPSEGTNISVSAEWGVPVLQQIFREDLPSANYLKPSLQARQFFDLDGIGKSVLALRGIAGKVILFEPDNPARDIPLTRRFIVGGPSSLRAWPSATLLMAEDTSNATALFGGYQMIEANVEWRFAPFRYDDAFTAFEKFLSDLRLGLFTDVGNAWHKNTTIELKNVSWTGGIGVRYNTIFGAIRLDWGVKLYDPAPGLKDSYEPDVDPFPPATLTSTEGLWLWERPWHFPSVSEIQFSLGLPF